MNIVDFLIRIKDMGSAAVARFAGNSSRAVTQVNRSLATVQQSTRRVRMSIEQLDNELNNKKRMLRVTTDASQIRRLRGEIEQLEARRNRMERGSSGGGLAGLLSSGAGLVGIGGIGATLVGAFSKGIERDSTLAKYMSQLGEDAGKGLMKYANKSGYGEAAGEAAHEIGAGGLGGRNNLAALTSIGKIANGDKQALLELSRAYADTAKNGFLTKMTVEEFNKSGFNLIEMLRKNGESQAAVNQRIAEGKVKFSDFAVVVDKGTAAGTRFSTNFEKRLQSPAGKITQLKTRFSNMLADWGEKLLPVLSSLGDLALFLGNNADILLVLAGAYGAYKVATNIATIQQWALNAAMSANPIGIIITLVGTLIAALMALYKRYEGWEQLFANINRILGATKAVWKQIFTDIGNWFGYWVDKIILGFQQIGQHAKAHLSAIGDAWKAVLNGDFEGAKKIMSRKIVTEADVKLRDLEADKKRKDLASTTNLLYNYAVIAKTKVKGVLKKKGDGSATSADDIDSGLYGAAAFDNSTPGSMKEVNDSIAAGGVKNLTINISKFQDKTEIHTTNLTEGVAQVEDKIMEMFLRVINSGGAAVS